MLKITSVEDKSKDWKIVSLITSTGVSVDDVSVNRTNKNGEIFPEFDGIVKDADIEATLWTSPTGKQYLFAPKLPPQRPKFMGGSGIAKAQETKAENIKEAQERKNEAIQLAGAFRDATLVSLQALRDNPFPTDEEYKAEWTKWVKFFLNQGDQPFI